jgi:transketolase
MTTPYTITRNLAVDMSDSTVVDGFDDRSWDMVGSLNLSLQLPTGSVLLELADKGHDEIVVCTADLGRPTQVINFGKRYPQRYFNFGIAERNMIGAAAGLATIGFTPFISNYNFFLSLMGAENIRNDVAYPNLKVRFVGTHSGLAMGFYGTSHHCNEDIGLLRGIAGLTLMAPCDANAIRAALPATLNHDGPIYFRVGRGREPEVYATPPDWKVGGSHTLREGHDTTVFAIGNLVKASLEAHDILAREGIGLGVVDMYSIRPIDEDAILAAAKRQSVVLSAEEHNVTSGFGSAVAEVLASHGVATRLIRIGMPDQYSILGPPTHLYRHYGLDGEGVANTVREALRGRRSTKLEPAP